MMSTQTAKNVALLLVALLVIGGISGAVLSGPTAADAPAVTTTP